MANLIKCPHCNREFEMTDVLKHQIEEDVKSAIENKLKKEIEEKSKMEFDDLERKLKEKDEKVKILQEQELTLREQKRKVEEKEKELELELTRKIDEARKNIEAEVLQKASDDHRLKDLEKDKLITDLKKSLEDAQRKANQGSQQSQGEVMELELEEILRREFPDDEISEVKKGQRGADIVQTVHDKMGRGCGKILWESKNAQWSAGWINKLRDDQREAKADLSVLVVENAPEGLDTFDYRERIWITKRRFFHALAIALRFDLIHIYFERVSSVGKDEKMEVIYQYLTGAEFKHRIEAIVDAFSALQENIEKEKRFFNVKWAREEKEIRKIIDNTHGMWGELQSVTNRSLPQIKSLELDSGDN